MNTSLDNVKNFSNFNLLSWIVKKKYSNTFIKKWICLISSKITFFSLSVDHTYKLYYGGAQKRPDGQASRTIFSPQGEVIGLVAEGNRKDVRNAVEIAQKTAPG